MYWLEVSTQVGAEGVDAVSELLARYVYGGVAIEQPFTLSSDGTSYTVKTDGLVTVKGYMRNTRGQEQRRRSLEEALWHLSQLYPIAPLQVRTLAEEDWATAWKEHFHPLRIGGRLVVKPTWRDFTARPGDIIIELDPGMAFGTGHHPSTRMCLLELEERVQPGDLVLDLGTGSGILAIAAARLGAAEVLALDIDRVAVEVARQNVALNNLSEVVKVASGSLDKEATGPTRSFHVIVANIVARVIAELAPNLALALRPQGTLIAGGIVVDLTAMVAASLSRAGLTVVSQRREDDWVTLMATHKAGWHG